MTDDVIRTMAQVQTVRPRPGRLSSASEAEIRAGLAADVYFARSYDLMAALGLTDTRVVCDVFAGSPGILCGVEEAKELLLPHVEAMWALPEGSRFEEREVVLRVAGQWARFGVFETSVLGAMAQASGWATAARECREAAPAATIFSFGARHVHPAVASVLDRAALVGGLDGASSILGARLMGQDPVGTVPHALCLIVGDTVKVAQVMAQRVPSPGRSVLVDTFHDEVEEALRVAQALGDALDGVRIDTPRERGGVTADLVRELRARLDQAGHQRVQIFCSGSLTPTRITELHAAGADAFGVGHHVSSRAPIDMTMDVKEVAGRPLAKRGRIPGAAVAPRLVRVDPRQPSRG